MEDRKKVIKDLNKLLDELPVTLTDEQKEKRDEIKDMLNKIEKASDKRHESEQAER